MPKVDIHCAISKQRTDKDFRKLHEWIDEPKKWLGTDHRGERHSYSEKLRNYIDKRFGGKQAVSEWLFHIALDNLKTYMKNEWYYNKSLNNFLQFGFEDNKFIHCHECVKEDLDKEFSKNDK